MEMKSGYKRSEVGIIPVDWKVEAVEDAFDICNELRLPLSQTVRETMVGPYPYYGPTSVQGWINHYRIEGEYALIGEDGDHFLKWRNQPMTLLVRGKFNVNNHAHLVRGSKNLTRWFYWYFANRDLTPYLTRQGAGRYKLTKASLLKIPCALPSPSEQGVIAEALSDVDVSLGGLERLIEKKRDLKQATMQQLLTGQTRVAGFHDEWKKKQIREIADLNRLNMIPSNHPNQLFSHFSLPAFDAGKIVPIELGSMIGSNKFRVPANAVLVSKLNPRIPRIWTPETVPTNAIASTEWLVLTPREGTDRNFLHTLCSSPAFCDKMELHATGTTGSHQRINSSIAMGIVVSVPDQPQEQTAIAEVLTDMDAEIAALEQLRKKTRSLKQAMMQELLTGKTRLI